MPEDNSAQTPPSSETDGSAAPLNNRVSGRGGPRTPTGKRNSSYNSTKHGIFTRVLILKDEPAEEYLSLLAGLFKDYQPKGKFEELLVEKLAMLTWRLKRLLSFEASKVDANVQLLVEETEKESARADANLQLSDYAFDARPLIALISDLNVLDRCIGWLEDLLDGIQAQGFTDADFSILKLLYGRPGSHFEGQNLFNIYQLRSDIARMSDDERQRGGYPARSVCVENMMTAIKLEIRKLQRIRSFESSQQPVRKGLRIRSFNIPEGPDLDLVIRYETHLERSFDHTLRQLERARETRLSRSIIEVRET